MAKGESQGLQIAVIVFTMLTVGLSISTYVYFQSYSTEFEKRNQAETQRTEAEQKFDKSAYKTAVYEYILGVGTISKDQLPALKTKTGGDPTADQALADFEKKLAGNEAAITETNKGLPALPEYLLVASTDRNVKLVDADSRYDKVEAEMESKESTFRTQLGEANNAKSTAEKQRDERLQTFTAELAEHKKDLDRVKGELEKKNTEITGMKKAHTDEITRMTKTIGELEKERTQWRNKYENVAVKNNSYETPDAEVTWVNQRERMVWINVGFTDGLTRQTTFSVYDHDENGVATTKAKGRVEVLRITGAHLAECRILEDATKNPILPGDKLFTPAWSPGMRLRFALAGTLDIDGDNRSDREEIRNIILMNGGLIDAEQLEDGKRIGDITYETRFLLRGKAPSERELSGDAGKRAFQAYTEMVGTAEKKGVELIDLPRFLSLMGWKAQEKTTTLGSKRTGGGKGDAKPKAVAADVEKTTEPEAEAPKAEKPAKPAAAMEDDPFK